MECIRYLTDDGVSAARGLAADEILMNEQARACPPPATLRLYTYGSHCALVGRFQDLDAEVNVPVCERMGIALNRRPTGGGAILMGADQLGVAFSGPDPGIHSRAILARLAEGIREGLASLGVTADLRGKNDLAVTGRKIAGLGVCRHESGAFLFHASVLLDLDVELMLRVLRIPVEKLGGESLRIVGERMTTVARELHRAVGMDELRCAVRNGFASALGARIESATLDDAEGRAVEQLAREKYQSERWIRERGGGRTGTSGVGLAKTPGGLVRAEVSLVGEVIQCLYLTGDFAEGTTGFLSGIEAELRWSTAAPAAVRQGVARAWRTSPGAPEGVNPDPVSTAICRAIEAARQTAREPYACYVGRPSISGGKGHEPRQ